MAEGFEFHSQDYASEEIAFAAYRELYARGADVERGAGAFHATVQAWRLDKVLLFERRFGGVRHVRADRVAADAFDHFTLTYVVSGHLNMLAASQPLMVRPGEAVLLDMRRGMQSEPHEAHIITASISRMLVEAAAGSAARLHGRLLDEGPTGLLGDYLLSLTRRSAGLAPDGLPAAGRALVDLLSVALGPGRAVNAPRRQELVRRETAQHFIAAEIARPDLSAEHVAGALGISRASLYRLFGTQGGVARVISERRVSLVRLMLESGDPRPLEVIGRSVGFTSAAAVQRQFQSVLGENAETFRKPEGETDGDTLVGSKRRWGAWLTEL